MHARRMPNRRHLGLIATVTVVVALAAACTPAWEGYKIAGFTPVAHHDRNSIIQDQGPATVYRRSVSSGKLYRTLVWGGEVLAKRFTDAGWTHLGDPDSLDGFIAYPYQYKTSDPAAGKMFDIVTPHGRSFEYTHPLGDGEEYNNSFAAISPDGQYLVSGEWDVEQRLLVFPMPILNHSVPSGNATLPLASTITFDKPVTQIQGCDFLDGTHLICSADDATKQLVEVTLSAPLTGADVTGTVTSLGKLPQVSGCKGTYEAEGLDFDPVTGLLRVNIIEPMSCIIHTDEYVYKIKP